MAEWSGWPAVIVGSGPSAAMTPLGLVYGRAKVIAINNSWRLAPWADVLFGIDGAWWSEHRGVPEFKGRKMTSSPAAMTKYHIDMFASIGNNSGLRAIYLAERLGADPILLVGFDMHADKGVHWHAPHWGKLTNPDGKSMLMWRQEIERVAPKFAAKGVNIVNCTQGSRLTCFPFCDLKEAFDGIRCQVRADQSKCSGKRSSGS